MITLRDFRELPKLSPGDKVAVVSPSYAAPARWPRIYELGLRRLRDDFGLVPVEYPTTCKLGASGTERGADLIAAFVDPEIRAVIATLGGDDQVTYVKNLPPGPFRDNAKPFFGFSDCTHLANFLWLLGVPSYYGGALFTQFAQTPIMDQLTVGYLKEALFGGGAVALRASDTYTEIGVGWDDPDIETKERIYEPTSGWHWDGDNDADGVTWGGCLESIDELLRHGAPIPSVDQFRDIVLIAETSEEIPSHDYVRRVFRAMGERGILSRLQAVLVGRPRTWEFGDERPSSDRGAYREGQREAIVEMVRRYNSSAPIVQNLDFGHTNPQICLPYGAPVRVNGSNKTVTVRL